MPRRPEEYVKVYVAYSPELLRKLKGEEARLAAALLWLTLSIEHGSVAHGTITTLADLAGVHRNTMRRYLLRLQVLGIGRYDAKKRALRLNPQMVFRGSEREREGVLRQWVRDQRQYMEVVDGR